MVFFEGVDPRVPVSNQVSSLASRELYRLNALRLLGGGDSSFQSSEFPSE